MSIRARSKKNMKDSFSGDDILREIWRVKDELSASYRHDVARLFADLRDRERRSGRRIVDLSTRHKCGKTR